MNWVIYPKFITRKGQTPVLKFYFNFLSSDILNFLRPFLRREANTARPLAVCMRLRKPWTVLRRRRCGWNVRFMIQLHFLRLERIFTFTPIPELCISNEDIDNSAERTAKVRIYTLKSGPECKLSAKVKVLWIHRFPIKKRGMLVKILGGIGRIKQSLTPFAAALLYRRMTFKVIRQAFGHYFSLREYPDRSRSKLFDMIDQQGIMSAS